MIRYALMLLALSSVWVNSAESQAMYTQTPFGPSETLITFKIEAVLASDGGNPVSTYRPLVAALLKHGSLAALDMGGDDPVRPTFAARFSFRSVGEFEAWVSSDSTTNLLQQVHDMSVGAPSTTIHARRPGVVEISDAAALN